jgi:hypothetical protein
LIRSIGRGILFFILSCPLHVHIDAAQLQE